MRQKTYKREIAGVMLAYCAAMGLLYTMGNDRALQVIDLFFYPSLAFAAGAFGFDEYAKNIIGKK